MVLGEERHEGGGKGALGKQPSEEIGQALRDEEGIGDRTCAERRGDQHVTDESEDAGKGGTAADGGEVSQEGHAGLSGRNAQASSPGGRGLCALANECELRRKG